MYKSSVVLNGPKSLPKVRESLIRLLGRGSVWSPESLYDTGVVTVPLVYDLGDQVLTAEAKFSTTAYASHRPDLRLEMMAEEQDALRSCELVWVTNEMMTPLLGWAEQIPPEYVLAIEDLIYRSGLVVFPQRMRIPSVDGGLVYFRAVCWRVTSAPERLPDGSLGRERPCVSFTSYAYIDEVLDSFNASVFEDVALMSLVEDRKRLEEAVSASYEVTRQTLIEHAGNWLHVGRNDWFPDTELGDVSKLMMFDHPDIKESQEATDDAYNHVVSERRFMAALWTLMADRRVSDLSKEAPTARKSKFRKNPDSVPEDERVTFLRLGKETKLTRSGQIHKGHVLRYRHRVREHTKMQPYGPGGKYRKQIVVPEYTRGPDGAPVRETDRVSILSK